MHFVEKKPEEKRIDLDNKLKSNKILRIPGAYNPLTAKVIEEIGYDGVYVSGGVMSNDLGYPDIGLTTLNDVSNRSKQIARVTNLPTIVDVDTGFKSCKETVQTFENFGISAIHLEDQIEQKRCGHRPNKELVSATEMQNRIKAAVDAKTDSDFMIMARTDAIANEGLNSALDRAISYVEAGADAIFTEAVTEIDQYKKFSENLNVPILANITEFGKTPLFSKKELKEAGIDMILYPLSAFRAMSKAAEEVYSEILEKGTQESLIDKMQTRDELYEVLDYHTFEKKLDDLFNE